MSKRILVVEDQPDNRQIIRDMLAPTDYEITEAENDSDHPARDFVAVHDRQLDGPHFPRAEWRRTDRASGGM
jgi:CheY-like chemotaxis protein